MQSSNAVVQPGYIYGGLGALCTTWYYHGLVPHGTAVIQSVQQWYYHVHWYQCSGTIHGLI